MPLVHASSSGVTLPIAESDVTSLTADLAAKGAATDVATVLPIALPTDYGYLTWSIDPALAPSGSEPSAAGVLQLIKVKLPTAATVSSVCLRVTTAAATGVTNCFAGLLDSSGTRQALTANLNTTWTSTGYYEHAFTAPYAAAAGTYYVGLLVGAAGTLPQFSRNTANITVNGGLSAGSYRFSTYSSSLSAIPSSVTLANQVANTSATATSFFVALK